MERNKSRNQSLYDFLQCLQKEYVNAELRSKIYPSIGDKKYYRKVMGYKEEKIEDISMRNQLPSIFNNQDVRNDVYFEVYTNFGCPNFVYKNETEKEKFKQSDLLNYFAVGGEIKIQKEDGRIEIGIIVDNLALEEAIDNGVEDLSKTPLAIKRRNVEGHSVVLIKQVSRIL